MLSEIEINRLQYCKKFINAFYMFGIPKILSVCNGYFTERRTIQQRNGNSDYLIGC